MSDWRKEYNETYVKLLDCENYDKQKYEKICRELVKNNFPNKLYKYSYFDDNEYWKETLLGEVFFQTPSQWNDLMDSACLLDYDYCIKEFKKYDVENKFNISIDELIKFIIQNKEQNETHHFSKYISKEFKQSNPQLVAEFHSLVRKLGIIIAFTHQLKASCFTEEYDNMKMWYYYAKQYTGFCIEYDFSNNNGNLKPVIYTEKRFTIKEPNQSFYETEVFLPMLLKNPCWKDEKEWRFIYPHKITKEKQTIHNCPIKAIYFGSDISTINIEQSLEYLKNRKETLPKVYKMIVNKHKNEFIAREIII